MIAEVSAWDPLQIGVDKRECNFLVMAYGSDNYETEYFATQAAAKITAKDYGIKLKVPVVRI